MSAKDSESAPSCDMDGCTDTEDIKTCKDPGSNLLYVCAGCRDEFGAVLETVSDHAVPGAGVDAVQGGKA